MVEGQRKGPVPGIENEDGPGIVGRFRLAPGPGDEHGRDGVKTRVPRGVGVGAELADELDLERGLFAGFPHGGRLERLAVVDESARQGPAGRRVPALDEDDARLFPAVHDLDDDVDGGYGIAEFPPIHLHAHWTHPIVGAGFHACQMPGLERGLFAAGKMGPKRPHFPVSCHPDGTHRGRRGPGFRGNDWHEKCY